MTVIRIPDHNCRNCGDNYTKAPLAGGCACDEPALSDDDQYPGEIEMAGGPNIVVESAAHEEAILALIRNNARLDAQGTP